MTAIGGRIGGIGSRLPRPGQVFDVRRLRPRPVELSAAAATAQWALLTLCGLALWLVSFGLGASALQEHHQQHNLYASFRQHVAEGTAPLGGAIKRGTPVTMLNSPQGGLHNLVAVEGTSSGDLRGGPGHYPGSMLPGQPGVAKFLGRATSFGGPFGGITSLSPGDTITATTAQGTFTYVVGAVVPFGSSITLPPTGGSQLWLVTAVASGWRSGWAPTHAVLVTANLKGATVSAPNSAGQPRSSDRPMKVDTSGLTVLVLWMQLLVIAVIGVVIGKSRWGVWQVWLVGTPIVLAALWGASQTAWQLLPNLV